jgi:hypothetical protein
LRAHRVFREVCDNAVEKRADEVDIRPHLLAIHHFAPRVYDAPAILLHIHKPTHLVSGSLPGSTHRQIRSRRMTLTHKTACHDKELCTGNALMIAGNLFESAIFPRMTGARFAEHRRLPRRNRSLHALRLESTGTMPDYDRDFDIFKRGVRA